ncbi:MAG: DUF302 domain-containing protein [Candidatus Thiodiazotropha sp.]|jgi:uncharacterized protein (DUF302 family)
MKTFTSNLPVEATVAKLINGIETENMRVVAHINGQANAAKMGKEVPADQILEVFRPDYAIRVWQACKPAGHDIPLRIHIYEADDAVVVACRLPSEVFAPYGSRQLDAIGEELDSLFNNILSQVPEA